MEMSFEMSKMLDFNVPLNFQSTQKCFCNIVKK